jgi:hypothetical protein
MKVSSTVRERVSMFEGGIVTGTKHAGRTVIRTMGGLKIKIEVSKEDD